MKSKSGIAVLIMMVCALAAAGQATRGKAEATVKGKKITIDYGKPKLEGRDMIGMAKPGMTWRLGMDDATEIQSTATLMVGGKELKPGKYTLWAVKKSATEWTLNFHPTTGVWGSPELTSGYIATMPLKLDKAAKSSEELTIAVADKAGDATITIVWGTAQLTAILGVK